MINHFVKVSVKDGEIGTIRKTCENRSSFVLNYPCTDSVRCTPYVLEVARGVYRFECWGSRGGVGMLEASLPPRV